jgi:hypothetical protein
MMDERHDELSTADLAGQRPRDDQAADARMDEAEVDAREEDSITDHRTAGDATPPDERADARLDELADERADERLDPDPTARPAQLEPDAAGAMSADTGAAAQPLLASSDAEGFRARWTDVQTGFVDAPRQAVESADALVAELMQHLAKTFADARNGLEGQWDRGDDVSTDDLRTAFQRYRSFFERLLST